MERELLKAGFRFQKIVKTFNCNRLHCRSCVRNAFSVSVLDHALFDLVFLHQRKGKDANKLQPTFTPIKWRVAAGVSLPFFYYKEMDYEYERRRNLW